MTLFTDKELAYLDGGRRLARIATVGKDGLRMSSPSAGLTTRPMRRSRSAGSTSGRPRSSGTSGGTAVPQS
jgi:hypothetical protein